jgi:hypothetical protein
MVASGERFDAITRLFGSTLSRRQAIKMAIGGAVGGAGLVALQQGTASAACTAGSCTTAPLTQCCDNGAGFICCPPAPTGPGGTGFACCPPNVYGGAFCRTSSLTGPGGTDAEFCCFNIGCTIALPVCCQGITTAFCVPTGFTCCGQTACPPGQACANYPPGVFTCGVPNCGPAFCAPGQRCASPGVCV